MTQISISQARQNFLQIANRVYAGEEFEVFKNGIPVMVLRPVDKKTMERFKRGLIPKYKA